MSYTLNRKPSSESLLQHPLNGTFAGDHPVFSIQTISQTTTRPPTRPNISNISPDEGDSVPAPSQPARTLHTLRTRWKVPAFFERENSGETYDYQPVEACTTGGGS